MRRTVAALWLACLVPLVLAGCAQVDIKVNIRRDLSADFLETLALGPKASAQLGMTVADQPDFWTVMRRYAEEHGWQMKVKAANRIAITGDIKSEGLAELPSLAFEQVVECATAYGGKRSKTAPRGKGPVTVSHAVERGLFTRIHRIRCELDLSRGAFQAALTPLGDLAVLVDRWPETGIAANLVVSAPFSVVGTNGRWDPQSSTVTWPVALGRVNTFEIAYLEVDFARVLIAIGMTLAGAALVVLVIVRRRRQVLDVTLATKGMTRRAGSDEMSDDGLKNC